MEQEYTNIEIDRSLFYLRKKFQKKTFFIERFNEYNDDIYVCKNINRPEIEKVSTCTWYFDIQKAIPK